MESDDVRKIYTYPTGFCLLVSTLGPMPGWGPGTGGVAWAVSSHKLQKSEAKFSENTASIKNSEDGDVFSGP